jgi:hypothetical protein
MLSKSPRDVWPLIGIAAEVELEPIASLARTTDGGRLGWLGPSKAAFSLAFNESQKDHEHGARGHLYTQCGAWISKLSSFTMHCLFTPSIDVVSSGSERKHGLLQ